MTAPRGTSNLKYKCTRIYKGICIVDHQNFDCISIMIFVQSKFLYKLDRER